MNDLPWYRRRPLVLAVGFALVVAAALGIWGGGRQASRGSIGGAGGEVGNDSIAQASGVATRSGPGAASGPALVEIDRLGMQLDASRLFQLGFGGGLVLDQETRATLDVLLTQMGEPSPQELEKLDYTLRQGLPREEAERAMKLFHGYRSYQAEMRTEAASLGIPDSAQAVDEYFARVSQIQRRHFDDATATALFGQEMRNARLVQLAAVIEQNPNLGATQKKEQLDALRAQLGPDQQGLIPEPSPGPASEAK